MLSAHDVAKYLLMLGNSYEDDITNLKLQKLLYYVQGFHLALFDKPAFEEEIQAWMHGPVCPLVYDVYKNGARVIQTDETPDIKAFSNFSDEQKELFEEVYQKYGQFGAWRLREMTHEETPWKNHANDMRAEITKEEMKEFFKTRIN